MYQCFCTDSYFFVKKHTKQITRKHFEQTNIIKHEKARMLRIDSTKDTILSLLPCMNVYSLGSCYIQVPKHCMLSFKSHFNFESAYSELVRQIFIPCAYSSSTLF